MLVYTFDSTNKNQLVKCEVQPDNYKMLANETDVVPGNDLYQPIIYHTDSQNWTGATQEAFAAAHPVPNNPATPEQQSITALAKENVTLKEQVAQVQQAMTLMAQTVPVTTGNTTTGGNK